METQDGAAPPRSSDDAIENAVGATRALATALDLVDHVAAGQLGIGRSDLRILDALSRHEDSLSAGELAEQVGLSRPALSAALNRLEKRNFVNRQMHPSDRRSVVVSATPAVQAQLTKLFTAVHEQVYGVLAELKPSDLRTVTSVVTQLTSAIQAAVGPTH